MKPQVLHSKLYRPRQRESTLFRPRLSNQLNAALHNQSSLILISAQAGSGKTTLLADWITQTRQPCAWISLDEEDNDISHLGRYLVASLATAGLDISEEDFPKNTNTFWCDFVHLIDGIQTPLFIVLDDYHRIQSPLVHEGIAFLIEHLPPKIYLVLATRSDPPLPLGRWRVRGQLAEIRKEDIRFTAGETAEFLNNVSGLAIDPDSVNALHQRTEGWIAGLQLAALSMQRHSDPSAFIAGFTGSHRFVLDYLTEEVLNQQDEQTRRVLLQTSILDRFDAKLCHALTGDPDSHLLLDQLYRANLFLISLDDIGQNYRYHHLFADLLSVHLEQDNVFVVADLHRRAGDWYAEHGDILDALHHYIAGQHHQAVAKLVEQKSVELFNTIDIMTTTGLIHRWSNNVIRQKPWLGVYKGYFLSHTGFVNEGELALSTAEQSSDDPNLNGLVAAIRTHIGYTQLQLTKAERQAEIALRLITANHPFIHCYAEYGLAKVLLGLDRLVEADTLMQQAFLICEDHPDIFNVLPLLSFRAEIAMQQNDMERADQYLQMAQYATEKQPEQHHRIASFWQAVRAQWLQKMEQLEEAFAAAQQALDNSLKHHNLFAAIQALLVQSHIYMQQRNFDFAHDQLKQAKKLLPKRQIFCDLRAEINLLEACVALGCDDHALAKTYLENCHTGESILLARQKQALQSQIATQKRRNPTIPTHPVLVEQLSPREYEVLQLIAQGLSNAEIAEILVVSVSTVKKHGSSILGKLDVSNRTQAVARAQELELLS